MKKSVILFTLWSAVIPRLFAQSNQEKAVIQKADAFTATQKSAWSALEKIIKELPDSATTGRITAYQQHPFGKAYAAFLAENGDSYAAARTIRFKEYAAPPAAMQQLGWQPGTWPPPEEAQNTLHFISLAFLRAFDPSVVAYMAFNLISPTITAETYATIEDTKDVYQVRSLYGIRLYTTPLSDSISHIWAADRSFAVSFDFNLRNGLISRIQHTSTRDSVLYTTTWPSSLTQPASNTSKLWAKLTDVMWNSYPGATYREQPYAALLQLRNEKLQQFYQQNTQQFIDVRTEQLQQLPQSAPSLSGYRELTTGDEYIMQYADTQYAATTFLYPQQWSSIISNNSDLYFEKQTSEITSRVQNNALFASASYAHPLSTTEWEVWTINEADATYYIWDIRSGYIKKVRYWVKE